MRSGYHGRLKPNFIESITLLQCIDALQGKHIYKLIHSNVTQRLKDVKW